jgi:hypothetical protein
MLIKYTIAKMQLFSFLLAFDKGQLTIPYKYYRKIRPILTNVNKRLH